LALAGAAAGRAGRWNSTIRLLWPVMPRSLGVALVRCSVAVDLAAPARPKRQSGGTSLIREKEAPPSE
jgi:hypothetical protein